MDNVSGSAWVAVWTRPRAEKAAARAIEARSVPTWLPTFRAVRRWSDRDKMTEFPLFPGYLFAQATPATWTALLSIPSVLTIVRQGSGPAWLSAEQISEIRVAVDRFRNHQLDPEVEPEFVPGDCVRVVDGPLAGLMGTVIERRGARRLIIGIEQIGRAFSLSIGSAQLAPVSRDPLFDRVIAGMGSVSAMSV